MQLKSAGQGAGQSRASRSSSELVVCASSMRFGSSVLHLQPCQTFSPSSGEPLPTSSRSSGSHEQPRQEQCLWCGRRGTALGRGWAETG